MSKSSEIVLEFSDSSVVKSMLFTHFSIFVQGDSVMVGCYWLKEGESTRNAQIASFFGCPLPVLKSNLDSLKGYVANGGSLLDENEMANFAISFDSKIDQTPDHFDYVTFSTLQGLGEIYLAQFPYRMGLATDDKTPIKLSNIHLLKSDALTHRAFTQRFVEIIDEQNTVSK